MSCFRPLKAYRAHGGGIVFDSKKGFGDRPLELACGQCIGCRLQRAREWALRCVHEGQMHDRNCIVTLTYDDEHLPKDGGLVVKDWQDFAKRLRKRMGTFRFFMCGEYGRETFRPHYHAILFGQDFHTDRQLWRRQAGRRYYVSPILADVWKQGNCEIGDFTYEGAEYVTRYILEKQTGDRGPETYGDLKPPFTLMSRKPGIGSAWFEKFGEREVIPRDEVIHKGRKFQAPRFYLDRMQEDDQVVVKERRRRSALDRASDYTPDRLKVREHCAEARQKRFERKI